MKELVEELRAKLRKDARIRTIQMAKAVLKRVDFRPAQRRATVLDDDTWIVSYPRSGNTWTRFLIANLRRGSDEEIDFNNIERHVPDIYLNTDRQLLQLPRPRLLKSHEYFDARYRKVILIARDPRDVAVSYYFHMKKNRQIEDSKQLGEFVDSFLRGGIDKYGTWGENVGSWLGARKRDDDLLLLRYEEMLRDPANALTSIASFLGVPADEGLIARAVSDCAPEKMRQLESRSTLLRKTRKDISFVRSAKAGSWEQELDAASARKISDRWGWQMESLGYL